MRNDLKKLFFACGCVTLIGVCVLITVGGLGAGWFFRDDIKGVLAAKPEMTAVPTSAPVVTEVPPTAQPTLAPTRTPTATSVPTVRPTATATPAPTATAGQCVPDSWNNANIEGGGYYGENPVGGFDETRPITWQGWRDGKTIYRFIFNVPPNTVVWIAGFTGGSGFYLCTDETDALGDLAKVNNDLNIRDGVNPNTVIAVLPEDAAKLSILLAYQVKGQPKVVVRKAPFGPVLTATATPTPTSTP